MSLPELHDNPRCKNEITVTNDLDCPQFEYFIRRNIRRNLVAAMEVCTIVKVGHALESLSSNRGSYCI